MFHAPGGHSVRGSVLYVHPFAEEMNKSRRMVALQSRMLAEKGFAVMHVHFAIEDEEHFRAVIDVPFVGAFGPVQANARPVDLGKVVGAPGAGSGEPARVGDNLGHS